MVSSVISRLNDRRDAAADLGEDAGFTLIELMVVLLILAILLAIAIPTFLGVTGGANDRSAQSNLNTALTTVKTAATQSNQSYTGVYANLTTNEPSIKWASATAVTSQGPVAVYISSGGDGVVLASFSKNLNTCWYAVDNIQAIQTSESIAGTPYTASPVAGGDATHVPTAAGTYYSSSVGACNPAAAPTVAQVTNVSGASGWATTFSSVA